MFVQKLITNREKKNLSNTWIEMSVVREKRKNDREVTRNTSSFGSIRYPVLREAETHLVFDHELFRKSEEDWRKIRNVYGELEEVRISPVYAFV